MPETIALTAASPATIALAPTPVPTIQLLPTIAASGPPGIAWTGVWSNSTFYRPPMAVSRSGSSYIALTVNSNIDPATDDGTNWGVLASGGAGGGTDASSIGGVPVSLSGLAPGDVLEDVGGVFTNEPSTSLTDGGNF